MLVFRSRRFLSDGCGGAGTGAVDGRGGTSTGGAGARSSGADSNREEICGRGIGDVLLERVGCEEGPGAGATEGSGSTFTVAGCEGVGVGTAGAGIGGSFGVAESAFGRSSGGVRGEKEGVSGGEDDEELLPESE